MKTKWTLTMASRNRMLEALKTKFLKADPSDLTIPEFCWECLVEIARAEQHSKPLDVASDLAQFVITEGDSGPARHIVANAFRHLSRTVEEYEKAHRSLISALRVMGLEGNDESR